MQLDSSVCYSAFCSRDIRFDGRFYTGVKTTGVYCRPICPAPTPLLKNCTFFPCAAAAEAAGFRPCLRCFPERTPGLSVATSGSDTISRAMNLIEVGVLDEEGVDGVAARLQISSRHLRRVFAERLGTTPIAVARTRRVQIAKRLLDETRLNMTQIAFAAGFQSIRQFNGTFRKVYGRSPRELRKSTNRHGDDSLSHIQINLPHRGPLDFEVMLNFLRPRTLKGIEEVSSDAYRRRVVFNESHGLLEISTHNPGALCLKVPISLWPHVQQLIVRSRRMFDLDADVGFIAQHLQADKLLARHLSSCSEIRVPGCWSPFEMSIRAILGQQVSVAGATTLCNRLINRWGRRVGNEEPSWHFPSPAKLARVHVAKIGIPATRARTIREFSKAVNRGHLVFDGALKLDEFVSRMTSIPGIGPWTAHYIAMRTIREPDAFPASDLGLRKALTPGHQRLFSEKSCFDRAESWRPWRSYAAMILWRSLQ